MTGLPSTWPASDLMLDLMTGGARSRRRSMINDSGHLTLPKDLKWPGSLIMKGSAAGDHPRGRGPWVGSAGMSFFSRVGTALRSVFGTQAKAPAPAHKPLPRPAPRRPGEGFSPGQSGPSATVEIDPSRIGAIRMTYSPATDGAPDPGEVVWTWVPFEERDGRGKDRPVLVVAEERGGTYLAVQLTSKPHQNNVEFVPIGSGGWDSAGRPSWVNIDRVFRLHPEGMRRETAGLPARSFAVVEDALRRRYGWR